MYCLSQLVLANSVVEPSVVVSLIAVVSSPIVAWLTTHAINTERIQRLREDVQEVAQDVDALNSKVTDLSNAISRIDERTAMMQKSAKPPEQL